MLQWDGVVMMVMKVLVMMMMMMMFPMKPSSMTVTIATIPPLREGISLANFCLPESFLSLCVFCPTEAAKSFCDLPLVLGFREEDIREGALAEVGQGSHTTWRRSQGWPAPGGGVGPWLLTSAFPSGYFHLLAK
jgi:hypothetical protein